MVMWHYLLAVNPYPFVAKHQTWMQSTRLPKDMVFRSLRMPLKALELPTKDRKSCNHSSIGSTSFFPSKPLGCYGDGGAFFTNDDEWADKSHWIRAHGQERKHHHPILGVRQDGHPAGSHPLVHLECLPGRSKKKTGNRISLLIMLKGKRCDRCSNDCERFDLRICPIHHP